MSTSSEVNNGQWTVLIIGPSGNPNAIQAYRDCMMSPMHGRAYVRFINATTTSIQYPTIMQHSNNGNNGNRQSVDLKRIMESIAASRLNWYYNSYKSTRHQGDIRRFIQVNINIPQSTAWATGQMKYIQSIYSIVLQIGYLIVIGIIRPIWSMSISNSFPTSSS